MTTESELEVSVHEVHPAAAESKMEESNRAFEAHLKATDPIQALDEAIKLGYESVELIQPPHPCRWKYLAFLSDKVRKKHRLTGKEEDLRLSYSLNRETISNIPDKLNYLKGGILVKQAISLVHDLYDSMGRLDDLNDAINTLKEATQYVSEESIEHPMLFFNLSNSLLKRHPHKSNQDGRDILDDLNAALSAAQQAVEGARCHNFGQRTRTRYYFQLSEVYKARYRTPQGADKDMFQALQHAETALSLSPEDDPRAGAYIGGVVGSLRLFNYTRTNDHHHLQGAIDVLSVALEKAGDNDRLRAEILYFLAEAWEKKYTKFGQIDDLTRARKIAYQAVAEGPLDDPLRLAASWEQLSSIFLAAYNVSEDDLELHLSTVAAMNALEAYRSTNSHPLPARHRLSCCLHAYYKKTKSTGALGGAIYMEDFGCCEHQCRRTGLCRKRRINWDHWANLLEDWARETRSISVFREAVGVRHELVRTICSPTCHCGASISVLLNLIRLLNWGYSTFSSPEYLEEALQRSEEALKVCPSNHPDLGKCFMASNTSYMQKYEQTKDEAFREKARQDIFKASQVQNAIPWSKLSYARAASLNLIDESEFEMASELLGRAVRLIPLVSSRVMQPKAQEDRLSSLMDLPAEACSVTLAAGKPIEEALELLELGRGVILGYKIDSRSDFAVLKEHAPKKYEELLSVRERINITIRDAEELPVWESLRQSALERWEQLLQEIRTIPVLKDFLLPFSANQLMELANYGPIVVLNCTSIRSDAIIITRESLRSIPLKMDYENLKERARLMKDSTTTGTPSDFAKRNKQMNQMLADLWDLVVGPVVAALGSTLNSIGKGALPRMWWIPVGLMSVMPIHAAGKQERNERKCLADIAISSYIPTIKALKYAREKSDMVGWANAEKSMLAVSMPTTPGEPDLVGCIEEVQSIAKSMEGISLYHLERPSTARVLEELSRGPTFVHFACHGETDLRSAMDSNLLLVRLPNQIWVCDRCESTVDLVWHCAQCNSGKYDLCANCISRDLLNKKNLHCLDDTHMLQVWEAIDDYEALRRCGPSQNEAGRRCVLEHPDADIVPKLKIAEFHPTTVTEANTDAGSWSISLSKRGLMVFSYIPGPTQEERSFFIDQNSNSPKENPHLQDGTAVPLRSEDMDWVLEVPFATGVLCFLDKMSKGRAFIHCYHQKQRGNCGARPDGCKDLHMPFMFTLDLPRAPLFKRLNQDGSVTHEALDRLTVERLSHVVKKNPSVLAYLSACSTARIANENLANESLHIASEFLLLGFVHVIGTLWEANDRYATDVAVGFYTKLSEAIQEGRLNDYEVARALHESVREVRERSPRNALGWATFIHFGA